MHRHFASLRSIDDLNALESETDHYENRSYSNKQDHSGGIYIYNEFEISEGLVDQNSTATKGQHQEYFPSHPKDLPQTHNVPTTPPLSPFKVIKQTFTPHMSEEQESSNSDVHRTNETSPLLTRDPLALVRRPPPANFITTFTSAAPTRSMIKAREVHIQKPLLFNAYPVAYIILWIPGILNRFIELTGHKSRTVAILQASTQFVGLANACK